MPTAICQKCGTTLRFEGLAALCPKCGTVLRLAAPPAEAAAPARQQDREAAQPTKATSGRRRQATDLSELDTGDPEVFEPDEAPIHHGLASLDPRLIKGFAVAMVLVLLFGLYVAFRPASSEVTVVTPSPPAAPPPAPVVTNTPPPPPPPPPVVNIIQPVVPSTAAATTEPAWMALKPEVPTLKAKPFTDAIVEQAIEKSAVYLKSQFADRQLRESDGSDMSAGKDALCVYALLQAGLAIDDPQLSVSDSFMQGLLDRLKQYPMEQSFTTYCRSLRASALGLGGRDADSDQLNKDYEYLLKSELGGKYTYTMQPPTAKAETANWDNSNCQYGVLGVWAAVLAGLQAPDSYWNDVEQHWLSCQCPDGGWAYSPGDTNSDVQMTCAGITTLCVTAEQLELIASKGKKDARPKMSAAIEKGLKFIGTGDNLPNARGVHQGYILYGIERAALATGYRWFGNHDWYRELGATELHQQGSNGAWDNGGYDGPNAETAFRVLFLSRGRQPIFMDKLRFEGDWNDRPRDVAKLTQFASAQLEKPFAWGVADLNRNWWDWLECPLLFVTTDMAPSFSDEDCAKLRAYTDAGGLIFLHNEYGAKDVDAFAISLAKRVYPEYPLARVAPDDLIYNCDFPIKVKPELWSVGNGTRTFMIFSPKDVTQDWVRYRAKDAHNNPNLQLAINLFVSAAGKTDFRNRLSSPYEPEPDFAAVGTLPIQQITYHGPWNAEPKAWERFGRWFQNQTSIKLDVLPTPLTSVSAKVGPVAVLTGNNLVNFSSMDFQALQQFVVQGGVLFIDSTGGNKAFAACVRDSLLPTAFPGIEPASLTASDAILAGTGPCMDRLPKPHLRNYASLVLNGVAPAIEYAQVGKGAVIISDLDVTTGLLDSGTYGIYGYTPAYCQSLMKNVILWALSRYSRP